MPSLRHHPHDLHFDGSTEKSLARKASAGEAAVPVQLRSQSPLDAPPAPSASPRIGRDVCGEAAITLPDPVLQQRRDA